MFPSKVSQSQQYQSFEIGHVWKICSGEPRNLAKLARGVWKNLPWNAVVPNYEQQLNASVKKTPVIVTAEKKFHSFKTDKKSCQQIRDRF